MTNVPTRHRKKPVVIEAMRLPEAYPAGVDSSSDGYERNLSAAAVIDWLVEHLGRGFDPLDEVLPASGWSIDPGTGFLLIATLEGVMQAKPGDWVIRGVAGEFYPCKPDIFAATYQDADAPEVTPTPGAELVIRERHRVLTEEGYSAEHDAQHPEEMARAGAMYALSDRYRRELAVPGGMPYMWPWGAAFWKPEPDDRVRELVKAGQLIVAELDRLLAVARGEQ